MRARDYIKRYGDKKWGFQLNHSDEGVYIVDGASGEVLVEKNGYHVDNLHHKVTPEGFAREARKLGYPVKVDPPVRFI